MKNVLLIGPAQPITFWSFNESLALLGKKCAFPPLGLLTVAGMIPGDQYNLKLVDLNVDELHDEALDWADAVVTSSMIIHWQSLEETIARCNKAGVPVLSGGPLPTQYAEEIEGESVFFLGEAETGFLDILEEVVTTGQAERRIIDRRKDFRPLAETPAPRWDLIRAAAYTDMLVQITRGCPESCTFCNIPALYGKTTRLKDEKQTLRELEALYAAGWRGSVMAVDDNFIGNRDAIVRILNEEIIPFQKANRYPFQFFTQASIRMSDDPELLEAMYAGGFNHVFCGIESPVKESLKFMGAQKNLQGDRSLLDKVKTLQDYGFEISAGFIVGLDADPDDVAEQMIDFIQDAGIPVAMVGILGVLRDTPDYRRFEKAGRLVRGIKYSGDSGLFRKELSYVPVVEPDELFRRHQQIVSTIHSADYYFARACTLIKRLGRHAKRPRPIGRPEIIGALRSFWIQGVTSSYKREYWKLVAGTLLTNPRRFPIAMRLAIQGHHMVTVTQQSLRVAKLQSFCEEALTVFERLGKAKDAMLPIPARAGEMLASVAGRLSPMKSVAAAKNNAQVLLSAATAQASKLKFEYRSQANHQLREFRNKLEGLVNEYQTETSSLDA